MCFPQFNENQSHLGPKASPGPGPRRWPLRGGAAASRNGPPSHGREGGLTEQDRNAALQSLRASIFHASGAVFVFMQIARAARWARAGGQPHPSPGSSLLPTLRLPGPGSLAPVRPSSPSVCTEATALSWTLGTQRQPEARLLPWGLTGGRTSWQAGREAAVTSAPGSAASFFITRGL